MQKKYDLGYASLAEFAKEAMRKRFEEIEESHRKKQMKKRSSVSVRRRTSLSDF